MSNKNSKETVDNRHLMDVYLYRYHCQRWWGNVTDAKYVKVNDTNNPKKEVLQDAYNHSGSNTCNISLLQHFHLSFTSIESFPPTFPITDVQTSKNTE
jgi:hypothetical protein